MPKLRTILALLCLAACLGVSTLWARRALWADVLAVCTPGGHWQAAASTKGGLVVFVSAIPAGPEWGGSVRAVTTASSDIEDVYGHVFGPTAVRNSLWGFKLAGGTFTIGSQTPGYHALLVPHWAVALPLAVPPLVWARGRLRRRRWAKQGRCRHCGYDLRGSPERCPECGEPVERAPGETVAQGDGSPEPISTDSGDAHRGGSMRRVGLRIGIALVALAAVGGGVAVLDRAAGASGGDGMLAVGIYDAADLAGARFWAPGAKAVEVLEAPEYEFENRADFPQVADRRPDRLWGLSAAASSLPAWDTWDAPQPPRGKGNARPASDWESSVFGDQIVITAPLAVHADYARLLGALRAPAGAAFLTVLAGESAPPAPPGDKAVQDAEAKLAEVLPEVRLEGVTLEAAFERVAEAAQANVIVDWPAIERRGFKRTIPVKLRVWDLPLSRVLSAVFAVVEDSEKLCPDQRLRFRAEDGLIRISTRAVLTRAEITVRIYDVRPLLENVIAARRALVEMAGGPRMATPAGPQNNQNTQTDDEDAYYDKYEFVDVEVEVLTSHLKDTIDPDSWRDNGGTVGAIFEWAGRLIVRQTPEGHRQVEDALKLMSEAYKD